MSIKIHDQWDTVVGNGYQRLHPQFRDGFPSRFWRIQPTLHFVFKFFFDVTFETAPDEFNKI